MTSRYLERSTRDPHLEQNISKTVGFIDSVPKDYHEMTYGVSNGHVTDDVT